MMIKRKTSNTFQWAAESHPIFPWSCFSLEWLVFHPFLQMKLFGLDCAGYPQREHSIFAGAVRCPSLGSGASWLPAHGSASGSGSTLPASPLGHPLSWGKGGWTPRQALRCLRNIPLSHQGNFSHAVIHTLGSLCIKHVHIRWLLNVN